MDTSATITEIANVPRPLPQAKRPTFMIYERSAGMVGPDTRDDFRCADNGFNLLSIIPFLYLTLTPGPQFYSHWTLAAD